MTWSRGARPVAWALAAYQLGFRDPITGELAGFEIDLVCEIALDPLGGRDKVRFVAMGAADRVPSLASGTVDLVARTMTMTCRDWRQVAFSTEYYGAAQRPLVPAGSGIDAMADLAGGGSAPRPAAPRSATWPSTPGSSRSPRSR